MAQEVQADLESSAFRHQLIGPGFQRRFVSVTVAMLPCDGLSVLDREVMAPAVETN